MARVHLPCDHCHVVAKDKGMEGMVASDTLALT